MKVCKTVCSISEDEQPSVYAHRIYINT